MPHENALNGAPIPHSTPKRFTDVSDNLAGMDSHGGKLSRDAASGMVIHFVHIPTGETCHFKAFLTAYEDQYESQWNEEEVFGRMDPISTFKRTRRRIRLGWDMPAGSEEEAILNLRESEKLLNMLYPVYEERPAGDFISGGNTGKVTAPTGDQRTIGTMVAPPLFKLKFANLIMDAKTGKISAGASKAGLVGTIMGLSYRPDIEQGFFGGFMGNIDPGALVPQTLNFDIDFVVHHQHGLGYRRTVLLDSEAVGPPDPRTNLNQTDNINSSQRGGRGFPYRSDEILKPRSK